jgi:hypothetical protein
VRLLAKLVHLTGEVLFAGILLFVLALHGADELHKGDYAGAAGIWFVGPAALAVGYWGRYRSLHRTNSPSMRKAAYNAGVMIGRLVAKSRNA